MYQKTAFPTIDMKRTGQRIATLRRERGLSVRDLQDYFGFEYPQAIYKWQWGETLPSVDNLFALARVLRVNMEDLLVEYDREVRQKAPSEWKEPLSYTFSPGRSLRIFTVSPDCSAAAAIFLATSMVTFRLMITRWWRRFFSSARAFQCPRLRRNILAISSLPAGNFSSITI